MRVHDTLQFTAENLKPPENDSGPIQFDLIKIQKQTKWFSLN